MGLTARVQTWRDRGERMDVLVLFDFLGFGLSAKPVACGYSLLTQADLVAELVDRFAARCSRWLIR